METVELPQYDDIPKNKYTKHSRINDDVSDTPFHLVPIYKIKKELDVYLIECKEGNKPPTKYGFLSKFNITESEYFDIIDTDSIHPLKRELQQAIIKIQAQMLDYAIQRGAPAVMTAYNAMFEKESFLFKQKQKNAQDKKTGGLLLQLANELKEVPKNMSKIEAESIISKEDILDI